MFLLYFLVSIGISLYSFVFLGISLYSLESLCTFAYHFVLHSHTTMFYLVFLLYLLVFLGISLYSLVFLGFSFRGSIRCPVPKKHGFQCNPGIDGGVEQKNMGFQFLVSFLYGKLCIIAAITSGAP